MNKKLLVLIIPFLIIALFFDKIVVVEKVSPVKVSIISCISLNGKQCTFDFLSKNKIIQASLFYEILEFSLLTPGDYSEEMIENINSYKKDSIENDNERKRKIRQLEINKKLVDFLASPTSDKSSLESEADLLKAITSLNQRLRSYIESIKQNSQFRIVFKDKALESYLYHLTYHLLEDKDPMIRFNSIPSGSFFMGESFKNSLPNEVVNFVTFSKQVEMATFETSQLEWFSIMGYNPSFFSSQEYCPKNYTVINGVSLCPNHPIETISIEEINLFISRLNAIDLRYAYRLPTEAEWEYASKGSTRGTYFFGEDESKLGEYAWFYENASLQTHERGLKKPNQFGLYDILGNVFEWTSDFYSDITTSYRHDPVVSTESQWMVTKGGSWYARAKGLRPAFRCKDEKKFRYSRIGFRLLRTRKKL